MLQSQGLRPFEPYRTLQLHPTAPRDLVVEAYWKLVERERSDAAMSPAGDARIADLNAAYRILMDDARRKAYDDEHGFARLRAPRVVVRRKRLGLVPALTSNHDDYYHLLRIDREADAEIIEVARTLFVRQAVGHGPEDAFVRRLLDEAYRTLRNPQLRAQYDATLGRSARRPTAVTTPRAPEVAVPPEPQPYDEPTVQSDIAGSPSSASDTDADDASPRASSGAEPATAPDEPAPPPALAAPITDAQPTPQRPIATTAAGPTLSDTAHPRRRDGLLARLRSSVTHAQRHSGPDASPEKARSALLADQRAAADARLLALKDGANPETDPADPGPAPPLSIRNADAHTPKLAELIILAGPQSGTRIPIGNDAVTLGSGDESDVVLAGGSESAIAPEHGRIWLRGDQFVFHQLGENGTLVAGQPLILPLVILEDGDEIQIAAHRFRFELSREG